MMIGALPCVAGGCHSPRYFNRLQLLLSISVERRVLQATPLTLLLFPSRSSAVTAGHRGNCDARPHRLVVPSLAASTSREWLVFLRMCQLQRARVGGVRNEGSFSLTNTVTQLPLKWVTSCTQTVPLLSTSVPPPRMCDYVTGTHVI